MVTTNQKHTIDSKKPKRKELKHTTKKKNDHTPKGNTKRRNEQRIIIKTIAKQG